MKYKIVKVEVAKETNEIQQAKDSKKFGRRLVELVSSCAIGSVGGALLANGKNEAQMIAGTFVWFICYGVVNTFLIHKLSDMYDNKGKEEEDHVSVSKALKK